MRLMVDIYATNYHMRKNMFFVVLHIEMETVLPRLRFCLERFKAKPHI